MLIKQLSGVLQQGKLQSFSTRAATSASYRPTKRPSDTSWNKELANYLTAGRANGAGRELNALLDRLLVRELRRSKPYDAA
jgi:hypothetical protein